MCIHVRAYSSTHSPFTVICSVRLRCSVGYVAAVIHVPPCGYTVALPQLGGLTIVILFRHCCVASPLWCCIAIVVQRHCCCAVSPLSCWFAFVMLPCRCCAACLLHAALPRSYGVPRSCCFAAVVPSCCSACLPYKLRIHCLAQGAGHAASWAIYLPAICVLYVYMCMGTCMFIWLL